MDTPRFPGESAKSYIAEYPQRLSGFLKKYEANEQDFVTSEIEYFENTIWDIQNSEASHNGFSVTGIDNFSIAYDLIKKIGYDKFYYSTQSKIRFLEKRVSLLFFQTAFPIQPANPTNSLPFQWGL